MQVKIVFQPEPKNPAPLYTIYGGDEVQAWVWLDLRSGKLGADNNYEMTGGLIGGSPIDVPTGVILGVVHRWPIRSDIGASDVAATLDRLVPVMQEIIDGASVELTGREKKYDVKLTDSVSKIFSNECVEDIIMSCTDGIESVVIDDLRNWLIDGGPGELGDNDPEEFIVNEEKNIFNSGMVCRGSVRGEMFSIWNDAKSAGETLPARVQEMLSNE